MSQQGTETRAERRLAGNAGSDGAAWRCPQSLSASRQSACWS